MNPVRNYSYHNKIDEFRKRLGILQGNHTKNSGISNGANLKKSHFIYFYAIGLVIVFLVMVIPGLKNECVPDEKIAELSFFSISKDAKDILIKKMNDFKTEHRKLVQDNLYEELIWQFLPPVGYLEKMEAEQEIEIDGERLFISKNKMRWLSNNIMSPSVWDEQNTFKILYNLRPERLDFNPRHFRYGGAWLYPTAFMLFSASKIGVFKLTKDLSYYLYHPNDIRSISITGKSFGIICYIIAIFILASLAIKFYNLQVGMIAVFFMVFCPVILIETVYFKSLLTSLMWFVASIYFILKIVERKGNTKRNAFFVGICGGFSAGSLLTSASILVPLFLAICYKRIFPLKKINKNLFKSPFADIRLFLYSLLLSFLTFLMTNFYILFSFKEFIKPIIFHHKEYINAVSFLNLKAHLENIEFFFDGLAWPFGLLSIVAIIWSILQGKEKERIILFAIFSYYVMAFHIYFISKNLHYIVPIIPLFILLSSQFIDYLFVSLQNKKVLTYLLVVSIGFYSILYSLFYVFTLRTQPRIKAGEWINNNFPKGTTVGTFINNEGLSYNYPYFNYFLYRFINDSDIKLSRIKKEKPLYYIMIIGYRPKSYAIPRENMSDEYKEIIDWHNISSQFRWPLKINEERELYPYYKEVKHFNDDVYLLGKFFENKLLKFWTKEIKIYKRIDKD